MMCCLLEAYHSLLLGFPLLQVLAIAGVLTNVIAGHEKKTSETRKIRFKSNLCLYYTYNIVHVRNFRIYNLYLMY